MKMISGLLGVMFLLLLLAAVGSAMSWVDPTFGTARSSWPYLAGLALLCGVLSVVTFSRRR